MISKKSIGLFFITALLSFNAYSYPGGINQEIVDQNVTRLFDEIIFQNKDYIVVWARKHKEYAIFKCDREVFLQAFIGSRCESLSEDWVKLSTAEEKNQYLLKSSALAFSGEEVEKISHSEAIRLALDLYPGWEFQMSEEVLGQYHVTLINEKNESAVFKINIFQIPIKKVDEE